jgi:hypothetical protein
LDGRLKKIGVIGLLLFSLLAHGNDFDRIAEIIGNIDTPRNETIPFVEKRQNQLLEEPLILHGEVLFAEDGTLSKRIERPVQERVTISGDSLELARNGRVRRETLCSFSKCRSSSTIIAKPFIFFPIQQQQVGEKGKLTIHYELEECNNENGQMCISSVYVELEKDGEKEFMTIDSEGTTSFNGDVLTRVSI